MMTSLFRIGCSLLCLILLISCHEKKETPPFQSSSGEGAKTVGRMTDQASLLLTAIVSEVQDWKGRGDWKVVVLQPLEVFKGAASEKNVRLLEVRPFPNQAPLFSPGEQVLVFLKDLPTYTAYLEMMREGVRYEVLGKSHGVVKGGEGKNVAEFVREVLKGSGVRSQESGGIKNYYFKMLQESPSKRLREDLSEEIFQYPLSGEELATLAKLVVDPKFPDEGKISLARGISRLSSPASDSVLKGFFCLSPTPLCLIAAQTLESRGRPPSVDQYSQALEKAPADLKTGLFSILARHPRDESFPLFQKSLTREKDETTAASIIESLGTLGGERAFQLVMQYGKDRRYYVRVAVMKTLGAFKNEKAIPVLEQGLKTGDPTMIMVAAKALQKIDTPKARETLSKYYEKEHHGYWEPTAPQHFLPKNK